MRYRDLIDAAARSDPVPVAEWSETDIARIARSVAQIRHCGRVYVSLCGRIPYLQTEPTKAAQSDCTVSIDASERHAENLEAILRQRVIAAELKGCSDERNARI